MKITYKYKLFNSDKVYESLLTELEYFGPILIGEEYEKDAIPKYNDPRDYFPAYDKSNFEWGVLLITDSLESDKSIRTEYFANGESQFTHRKDKDGFELIIQSFLISSNEIIISRIERKGKSQPWINTNFSLGVNFNSGGDEKWYNLKKGELK